jgi:hypothetical protein
MHVLCLGENNGSQLPAAHRLPGRDVNRVVPKIKGNREAHAGIAARGDHFPALICRRRKGLLAKHVPACFGGTYHVIPMSVIWGTNKDCLDFLVSQQVVKRIVGRGTIMLGSELAAARSVPAANRDQAAGLGFVDRRRDEAVGVSAGPD